ncbi:hypothetical protein ACSBR2_004221 [Camellia fascicularis]
MEDGALEKLANNSMPCVGMEFDSEEGAYDFYNEYGRIMGFSIRRDYHTKTDDTGISLKASHDLISALAKGKEFVGFTREDQKTYLRAKRQRNLQYGEAGSLLRYFQQQAIENPYFYFAFQLDVDEMITNIFWADHQMITDFGIFGDVVSFDTTFRTNKE